MFIHVYSFSGKKKGIKHRTQNQGQEKLHLSPYRSLIEAPFIPKALLESGRSMRLSKSASPKLKTAPPTPQPADLPEVAEWPKQALKFLFEETTLTDMQHISAKSCCELLPIERETRKSRSVVATSRKIFGTRNVPILRY